MEMGSDPISQQKGPDLLLCEVAHGLKAKGLGRSLRERASKKDMEDHVLFRRSLALGGAPELSALRSNWALNAQSRIELPLRICALIPSRRAAHDASAGSYSL